MLVDSDVVRTHLQQVIPVFGPHCRFPDGKFALLRFHLCTNRTACPHIHAGGYNGFPGNPDRQRPGDDRPLFPMEGPEGVPIDGLCNVDDRDLPVAGFLAPGKRDKKPVRFCMGYRYQSRRLPLFGLYLYSRFI